MSKFEKVIKATAAVAVVTSAFAGIGTPITAEASAVGALDVKLSADKTSVVVDFKNDTNEPVKLYRDNSLIQTIPTGVDKVDYQFTEGLKKHKFNLGKLSEKILIADGALNDEDKQTVDITIPQDGLNTSERLTYKIQYSNGFTTETPIDVSLNPDKVFWMLSSDKANPEGDYVEAVPGEKINIELKDVVGNYLYTYMEDSITGAKTAVSAYLLTSMYDGANIPVFKNAKVDIVPSNTKVASSVNLEFFMPEELKDSKAKIEVSTGFGAFKEIEGTMSVNKNTTVQARLSDGLGNYSMVTEYAVNNIVGDFGKDYKVVTEGEKLTITPPAESDYLSHIEVSINGSKWTTYSAPIIAESGIHKVETRSVSKDGTESDIITTEWIVGAEAPPSAEQNANAEYKDKYNKAVSAVVAAETDKTQANLKAAEALLADLSVADKKVLEERLDDVQDYVNASIATEEINNLKSRVNIDTLIKALFAIGGVEDKDMVKDLEKSIETLMEKTLESTTAAKIDTAVEDLVELTLKSPSKGALYAIEELLPHVTDKSLREDLESDMKEIKVLVDSEDDLIDAEDLLVKAEKAQTSTSYKKAKDAVSKLPTSDIRKDLEKRLERLEKVLGVLDTELIDDILDGDKVSAKDIAKYAGQDVPSSLVEVISESIKDLKDHANESNVEDVVELHVAYDKAVRSMIAKDINSYAKLYQSVSKSLPTIKKMPDPNNLSNAYMFLTDESVFEELVKGLEEETGESLAGYFRTLAPSVIKTGGTSTSILDYASQTELETNRTYQVVKAALLTKEALVQNKDEARTLAKTYVDTLKNGGYKKSLLSSLGVTGKTLEKAGDREDTIYSKDGNEVDEEGKELDEDEKTPEIEKPTPGTPEAPLDVIEDLGDEQPTGTLAGIGTVVIPDKYKGSDIEKFLGAIDKGKAEMVSALTVAAGTLVELQLTNGTSVTFTAATAMDDVHLIVVERGNDVWELQTFVNGAAATMDNATVRVASATGGHMIWDTGVPAGGMPKPYTYVGGAYEFKGKPSGVFSKAALKTSFADMSKSWATTYVDELGSRGILTSTTGSFSPTSEITRAEFAVWIARMIGVHGEGEVSKFNDMNDTDYGYGYIHALTELGIIKGKEGSFMPDETITRQQAALILARTLNHLGVDVIGGAPGFDDTKSISVEAQAIVGALQKYEIFTGSNGKFSPADKLTRQQAAKVVFLAGTTGGSFQ